MRNTNILISGASVAGPALAYWLSRYGFNPTVVERAPAVRPGGYAVDFRGAAMKALERMGIIGEIRKLETRTGSITIVDKTNRKIASMPDGFTSGELEIMRGDLAGVLYGATRDHAEYIFDDSILAISEDEDGAEVTFSRNAPRRFDLVVGADGLHSNVRALAFGEESRFIHHLGYYVAIFTTPNFMNLDHSGLYYGTFGKKVGIFSARENTEAKASFFFGSHPLEYDRRDIAHQRQILARQIRSRAVAGTPASADDGGRPGLLLRLRQSDQDGTMVDRALRSAWGCSTLCFPAVRNGHQHGYSGSLRSRR